MQFQRRNSNTGKLSYTIKLLIKLVVILLILFLSIILLNKIDFPSPNKKIEKNISNENFKVVK
tara:strand:+ start:92 stop:280 length:189 start_codon:yes stop_codon:yes gene_type:complete